MDKKIMSQEKVKTPLEELFDRHPALAACRDDIQAAFQAILQCYMQKGKLLVCGNGGSAADADHIVGELMKGFYKRRPLAEEEARLFGELAGKLQGALPAIALTQHTALSTAYLNDVDASMVFAQQVYGYGNREDVLLAISTSGNSDNVCKAVQVANVKGMVTIGLTGATGGKLSGLCRHCICVPETETARVQELHLPVYHVICEMVEQYFFNEPC